MKYRDLRDFMAQLETLGEVRKLDQPVSPKLEMTAIGDQLLRSGGPAVLCTQPLGYKISWLINLFGTPKRVALGMGAESLSDLLLSELPPRRLDTLREVKRAGPVSIYAVAKALSRNYSNVHADVQKLIEHGLVEKDGSGRVFVPSADVVVRVDASLLQAA